MNNIKFIYIFVVVLFFISCTNNTNTTDGGGGGSSLPALPPDFVYSPLSFPNSTNSDLSSLGIYNQGCDCDVDHVGWDLMPSWSSYPENKVPVIAVADGAISRVTLDSFNEFQGYNLSTFIIVLQVSTNVAAHYTIEPFVQVGGVVPADWVNVSEGDSVSAGDVIGYLPKIDGNILDEWIHLDFKVGTGEDGDGNYACPTDYFSDEWQSRNLSILNAKIGGCPSVCCEAN